MKPVLYRYRDSESVIKQMDGYTPGEGWTPLYSQDQVDKAVDAVLERAAGVLDANAAYCAGLSRMILESNAHTIRALKDKQS